MIERLTLISTVILGNLIGTYVDKCQHAFFVCISMLLQLFSRFVSVLYSTGMINMCY